MPPKPPTVADLRKAGVIGSTEIVAAVDLYMRAPTAGPYRFASGHSVNVPGAVAAAPKITEIKASPGPQKKAYRTAVTAAVMEAPAVPPATRR
jgi:hypothetical protein